MINTYEKQKCLELLDQTYTSFGQMAMKRLQNLENDRLELQEMMAEAQQQQDPTSPFNSEQNIENEINEISKMEKQVRSVIKSLDLRIKAVTTSLNDENFDHMSELDSKLIDAISHSKHEIRALAKKVQTSLKISEEAEMKNVMKEIFCKLKGLEKIDLDEIEEKVSLLATEKRELEKLTTGQFGTGVTNVSISLIDLIDLTFAQLGDETLQQHERNLVQDSISVQEPSNSTYVASETFIGQLLDFGASLDGYEYDRIVKFSKEGETKYFGEHNKNNRLHGKGIRIWPDGSIDIQHWNDGFFAPGNFLMIQNDNVEVGECYMKDGNECSRGTSYSTDGTTLQFGHDD